MFLFYFEIIVNFKFKMIYYLNNWIDLFLNKKEYIKFNNVGQYFINIISKTIY